MFGLGFGHLLLLAAIGLIVLGPEQMTELARVLGRTVAELKKAMREVTSTISLDGATDEGQIKSRTLKEAVPPPVSTAAYPPVPEGMSPPLPPVPDADVSAPAAAPPSPLTSPLIAPSAAAQMKFELKPETKDHGADPNATDPEERS